MLKKDLYVSIYILTASALTEAVAYYVFVLQQEITDSFNQDSKLVQVAANQTTMGQQIVQAATGMRYAESQKNFDFFRNELIRIYPQWQKGHQALINGDLNLEISQPSQTDAYLTLQDDIKFLFFDIDKNRFVILDAKYTVIKTDANFLSFQRSFEAIN